MLFFTKKNKAKQEIPKQRENLILAFLFLATHYATWYSYSSFILARVSLFVCFLCKLDFAVFSIKRMDKAANSLKEH